MNVLRLSLLISVVAFTAVGQRDSPEQRPVAPPSCPVTLAPAVPFTPPGEHKMGPDDNSFWLGTEKLWIALPKAGEVWGWGPRAPGHGPRASPHRRPQSHHTASLHFAAPLL